MSDKARLRLILCSGAALLALLIWGYGCIPRFGHYRGPYGDLVDQAGVNQRHVTDMATAINFDIRGFDTLGEEFILFTALAGLSVLFRGKEQDRRNDPGAGHGPDTPKREIEQEAARTKKEPDRPEMSDATRWLGLLLTGATNLFGLYIVLHAHLSPGGGFQGGALLGTACLLVFIATRFEVFCKLAAKPLMDAGEAAGAGGYAIIGIATLLVGAAFLQNVLPLGKTGDWLSGGTIPVINAAVGLEVAAGFVLLFREFLAELYGREPEQRSGPQPEKGAPKR